MKTSPRILFVGNFLIRHWGAGRTGIDMRLAAGAVRLNCPFLEFSERDVARFLAPLGVCRALGARMMNARLVKTVRNFRPDVVFIGHCDYVANSTIAAMRAARPGVRIAHLNCDPIDSEHCRAQIARRMNSCDAIFLTTAGADLRTWCTGRNLVAYFPNPSDAAFETLDNSRCTAFRHDLFFAGRPALADARRQLLEGLLARLDPGVRFGLYGMNGRPLVVGRDYEEAIAEAKMGLSINRFENRLWYASDRVTHLMGNGLLTFMYDGNGMDEFFSARDCVYFHTVEELAEKIAFFNRHDAERRAVAASGRARYHALFDSRRVLKYLVETLTGEAWSEPYEWRKEVYR
ncbi:MAG: glycosyltransferase [Kiritimatiellia bacterium]